MIEGRRKKKEDWGKRGLGRERVEGKGRQSRRSREERKKGQGRERDETKAKEDWGM